MQEEHTNHAEFVFANGTDQGCVRQANEDYYLFIEPADPAELAAKGRLVLVADGMGGYRGGQIASRLAANTIRDVFRLDPVDDPVETLRSGFIRAHDAIRQRAAQSPELFSMGTTCTAAILRDGLAYIGHIGDSRLYLIRGGVARQLTTDHTVISEMLARGEIRPEEARTHEKRHILSRALGVGDDCVAEFFPEPLELEDRDLLLFCSDGLHGLVNDEELAAAVMDQSPDEACEELIAWARVRGGPDNITVQIVQYNPEARRDS